MDLTQSIEQLPNCFDENELAYFALTSKVEQPIRDKLAFHLFNKLKLNQTILREWKRVDIAALSDNGEAEALIELTATQTCDLALKPELAYKLLEKVASEEAKLKKFCSNTTKCFTVLLATHIHNSIPDCYTKFVKYHDSIARAFDKIYYPEKMKSMAQNAIAKAFIKRELLSNGEIFAGNVLETNVSILYWVYKS